MRTLSIMDRNLLDWPSGAPPVAAMALRSRATMSISVRLAQFLPLAALCIFGCDSNAATMAADAQAGKSPRLYVGTVDGSDARVALVATAHHARIYFCGGPSSYMDLTR